MKTQTKTVDKHTPGPWEWAQANGRSDKDGPCCFITANDGRTDIAALYGDGWNEAPEGEQLSNAQLIAAAPALLAACAALLSEADDPPHPREGCTCPCCQARAAIAQARARGEGRGE